MQYRDRDVWCAIYCRLSQEDKNKTHEIDDSLSIQNQKSMLLSYAQTNNWKVYKIYTDDDYTGADRSRPAFNELLNDAREGKFQIVLCKSQSRFTRELELVERYLHELFPQWGIRFIGLVDNADTENKGNKKARQINGLINEWYLEDLSENIKEVLTDRRKKGYHIGAFAAYGYQKDPDYKGHLIPDPDAAKIVHLIFEMFASGTGKLAIARYLNEQGIPNPTHYKIQKGIRKKTNQTATGKLWQYFEIADILTNEVYIGNLVQGRYGSVSYKTHKNKPIPKEKWIRVENTHAPIIERELWDKVQDIIKMRTKPGWDGENGMFARKARCMYCGGSMRTAISGHRRYLTCNTKKIMPDSCKGGFIGQNELQETILDELHQIINKYLDMDAAEQQLVLSSHLEEQRSVLISELQENESKLLNLDKTLKTLYQDRVQGVITADEFRQLSADFKDDNAACKKRISDLQEEIRHIDDQKKEELSKRDILLQCAEIEELNFDIVNTLIDYVEVGKRETHYRRGKVPVIIHWKF